jgi:DNA-binding NtrC family response regulator
VIAANEPFCDFHNGATIDRLRHGERSGRATITDCDQSSLEDIDEEAILTTLEATGGNKSETARRLKINRKTLHKKLKDYGVGRSL